MNRNTKVTLGNKFVSENNLDEEIMFGWLIAARFAIYQKRNRGLRSFAWLNSDRSRSFHSGQDCYPRKFFFRMIPVNFPSDCFQIGQIVNVWNDYHYTCENDPSKSANDVFRLSAQIWRISEDYMLLKNKCNSQKSNQNFFKDDIYIILVWMVREK